MSERISIGNNFKMERISFQRIIRTNIKSEQIYIITNFYWNEFLPERIPIKT
jgi:hypothetical protein